MSASSEAPAIELRGLRHAFGSNVVLDGIDLQVAPGQIVGYLGGNGAGKSTTIKILLGLVRGFTGEARVRGLDPRTQACEIRALVGYVAENAALYEQLTIAEHLLFVGRLQGLDDALIQKRANALLETFELAERSNSRIATLSKGMRQKVMLTGALLHVPKVLFVDEPLSGLDANAQVLMKDVFRGLADRGAAILYSSHVLDVVQKICDRIVILDKGRIAAQGTFDELSRARGDQSLERIFVEVTHRGDDDARVRKLFESLT